MFPSSVLLNVSIRGMCHSAQLRFHFCGSTDQDRETWIKKKKALVTFPYGVLSTGTHVYEHHNQGFLSCFCKQSMTVSKWEFKLSRIWSVMRPGVDWVEFWPLDQNWWRPSLRSFFLFFFPYEIKVRAVASCTHQPVSSRDISISCCLFSNDVVHGAFQLSGNVWHHLAGRLVPLMDLSEMWT